ncbi:LPS assembly protein LptD [Geomonas sp. RF6]|uniref:LPS-assembly protein LptD n=1 Tax=Geomonas sp. RF6 TaxID=2897342 RepID=UPI001E39D2A5|nr:LPS assembly protein LptD [Geomonas sp. RF6]UFS71342.1 LPS assembly protein LptD [Geomonas sp. RF6]
MRSKKSFKSKWKGALPLPGAVTASGPAVTPLRKKGSRALLACTLLLPLCALSARAEEPARGAAEVAPAAAGAAAPAPATGAAGVGAANGDVVRLSADSLSFDLPTETYEAKGSVRLQRYGASLFADRMTFNTLSQDAVAEGSVRLERGDDVLRGQRIWLNLLSRQGELLNGDLFVKKSNFRLRGDRLQKTGDEDYHLDRGTFTTCEGEHPSWHFEVTDLDVTLNQYATGRHAVFYAGDVPLFYTPYLLFPVLTERSSGLLFPKFGRSTKKGTYFYQPFYWAISPSQDLTVGLDLQSARGVGTGFEYRYIRKEGSQGMLLGNGLYDTNERRFRGEVVQKHLEMLTPRTTFASDIALVSDRAYYRDFGETAGQYNRQLHESSAYLSHRWDRYEALGGLRYVQSLQPSENDPVDNTTTLQRLPLLSFVGTGDRIGPLYFSLDSSAVHFERESGGTGERVELHPRLSYYAKPGGMVDFSLYGGYHQRFYHTFGADTVSTGEGEGEADAGATVGLPLEKIYGGTLRHLLVPQLNYTFVQQKYQEDLPFFDYGDRVVGQSILGWALSNVFTTKRFDDDGTPRYRELMNFTLSQGYQFSGDRRDLLTFVDEKHHWTDLMLEGRLSPWERVTLAVDSRYNPVDNNLSTGNLSLEAKGDEGKEALVAYRYSREHVNYLEAHLGFPIGKPFFATVLARYSLDGGGFLESRYALEYRRQCWSITTAYIDRTGNREVMVNFTLAGIGLVGGGKVF